MFSILVIDDDAQVRAFIRRVLEGEGWVVREAGNGVEGMAAYRQRPADLVVCDIFMPEKEGLDTIRGLHDEFPNVKVVAMSGGNARLSQVDLLPWAKKYGAAAALHKPIAARLLVETVKGLLRA